MRKLQVTFPDDLASALSERAAVEGVSEATLIRRCVAERLGVLPSLADDPLSGVVGLIAGGSSSESSRVDDVVY